MTDGAAEKLKSSFLAERGLLDAEAQARAIEVLAQVEEHGIETVRLVFPDQHGILHGKAVTAGALLSALCGGITAPSTLLLKDTSQRTVFPVWSKDGNGTMPPLKGASDILLVPDPRVFHVLPWAPSSAWLLCDVSYRDGGEIAFAPRTVLRRALAKLREQGMSMACGLEVEFHVFRVSEENLAHGDATMPGTPPRTALLNHGYNLLAEDLYDPAEEILDELRRCCQGIGLPVRSTEIEFGPSQFEFTFDPGAPLDQADAMMLFRALVKQVCARRGLHATFMCRPKVDNGAASGWHLHQSVMDIDSGRNLFMPEGDAEMTPVAAQEIAGLLEHARECCLLTTPTVNGYKRYQSFQLAPDRIQWGYDNSGAMVRALFRPGDPASRVENRVAEPVANPYYYIASQILAGLDGVARGLEPPPPTEEPYAETAPELPPSLIAAIEAFEDGTLFAREIGADFVAYLSRIKRAEWERYLMTVSEWEQKEYFTLY